jgi:predicted nucleotidyltransferase
MSVGEQIDLEKVRAFLRSKEEKRSARLETLLAEAQSDARAIISRIAAAYSPRRIWQWGSLVDTGHFSEISDIDIAVEGLARVEDWFAIVGDAMRMTRFPIDIIELERVHPETAEDIRLRGRLVHERREDR